MKKTLSNITVTLLLVAILALPSVFMIELSTIVRANPIPWPTLLMPEEHINATIANVTGNILAKVDGAYPFVNIFYKTVRMDYPVPPNATNISVFMNTTELSWTYNNKTYPNILGNWPMINWTISDLKNFTSFTIRTHYDHPIPVIGGNYTFLYAMGTGRFLSTYAKNTTAYVRIRMETGYKDLGVYTVGNVSGTWTKKPKSYITLHEGTTDVIWLNVTSQMWTPLKEDLIVTFKPAPSRPTGGYSFPTSAPELQTLYLTLITILATSLATIKRKTRKTQ